MRQAPQKLTLSTLKILWGALLASHFIYGAMLYFQISSGLEPLASFNPVFVPVFSTLGLITLSISFFLPKYMLKAETKGNRNHNSESMEEVIQKVGTPLILRWALIESVSIFGFSLSIMSTDMKYFLTFAAVAISAHLMNYPSEEKIKNLIS